MPGEKIGIQAMKRSLIKTWLWASICLALLVPRLRCPFFEYNFWCFDWQTQVKAWQWGASRLEPQHYQYTEDIQDDYIKNRHINIIIYMYTFHSTLSSSKCIQACQRKSRSLFHANTCKQGHFWCTSHVLWGIISSVHPRKGQNHREASPGAPRRSSLFGVWRSATLATPLWPGWMTGRNWSVPLYRWHLR